MCILHTHTVKATGGTFDVANTYLTIALPNFLQRTLVVTEKENVSRTYCAGGAKVGVEGGRMS